MLFLKLKLQRKLNTSRGFTRLHDRLCRRWRHGSAASLCEHTRLNAWRTNRSVAWVVEVCMIKSIEHFGSELDLHTFSYCKRFDKPEIYVPVARRRKDVSARTILARCRQTKRLGQINATGSQCYRLEEHWPGETLTGQLL